MARCYLSLNKYSKSLEFSRRAASYQSENLADIYLLMGKTYQQMDEPWDALRTYRYAASQFPGDFKLQYALGETYVYLDKPEFAGDAFKAAITAAPDNAASHYQLGVLYYINNYNTPALLSLSVSLLLEPDHARASSIRHNIVNLLARELESKNIDEGDFQTVDTALNRQRVFLLKDAEKYSDFEIIKAQYLTLYKELDTEKIKSQRKTFVIDTYIPLYNKLHQRGLDETSVYYIFQNSQDKVINNWLKTNSEKVKVLERIVKNLE
jgi:tetratricopeptide (TPR) repeat protein